MMTAQIKFRVLELLEPHDEPDRISKACDYFLLTLVLLNVMAVILESVEQLRMYSRTFLYFELFSVAIFTIEFLCRIWAHGAPKLEHQKVIPKGRLAYFFSFHGLIDFLAILPFYLQVLFPGADLRILRVLRLLRVFKLSNYSTALEDLISAIHAERRSFAAACYLLLIAIILTSSTMYFAEKNFQPEEFASIPHAMYWSLITLTTVGYGDISPVTNIGKAISVITAFLGVSIVAMLTGIVASSFTNQLARKKAVYEEQIRKALHDGVIDEEERALLERLKQELGLSDEQVENLMQTAQSASKRT